MNVLAEDERRHPAGASPDWSESYWFGFYEESGRWASFVRAEFAPAGRTSEAVVCVFFPDGSLGLVLARDRGSAAAPLEIAGLRLECEAPLERWRVRYAGDVFVVQQPSLVPLLWDQGLFDLPRRRVELDLSFEALHAPVDFRFRRDGGPTLGQRLSRLRDPRAAVELLRFPARLGKALSMGNNRHYQQTGRVRGRLAAAGEQVAFAGAGVRDHSWGIRDWTLPRGWRWFSAPLGEGLAFSAHEIELLGSRLSAGYLWRGERLHALTGFACEVAPAERQVRLELQLADGSRVHVTGELLRSVALPARRGGSVQTLGEGYARYSCDGRSGLGIAEIAERVDR